MQISADFVTWFDKFLFQLKALQKRVQKDVNRFIVPQAVPEIYMKNERWKNRGMCVFVIDCISRLEVTLSSHLSVKWCKTDSRYTSYTLLALKCVIVYFLLKSQQSLGMKMWTERAVGGREGGEPNGSHHDRLSGFRYMTWHAKNLHFFSKKAFVLMLCFEFLMCNYNTFVLRIDYKQYLVI